MGAKQSTDRGRGSHVGGLVLLYQAVLGSEGGGLGATGEAQLVQDAAHVVAGGVLADDELSCNFFVSEALGDQGEHLPLPIGEQGRLFVLLFGRQLLEAVQHPGGNCGVQQRLASGRRLRQ